MGTDDSADQPAPSAATEATDVERIEEIRQRVAVAVRGPWGAEDGQLWGPAYDRISLNVRIGWDLLSCCNVDEDTLDFIAHSRDDAPWLLAHIDALRTDRDLWHQRADTALRLQDLFETWSVRWKTAAKRYRDLYRKTVELDPLAASTVHRLNAMADELEHLEEERSHLIRLNAIERGENIRLRADLAASRAREEGLREAGQGVVSAWDDEANHESWWAVLPEPIERLRSVLAAPGRADQEGEADE